MPFPPTIRDTPDAVLTNHRMVRDGGVWKCMNCPFTQPFPLGMPAPGATDACVPRRWLDRP